MPTKDKKSFIPSDSIKRSISTWEGIAMDGPSIDPLSKKLVKRNNSFEREAELFYNAIPENLRDTILSNQSLADNLYSYSYNVGSGNFKKRVVPALEHYYGSFFGRPKEVVESMYAEGDAVLPGLAKRRDTEKKKVRENLPRKTIVFPVPIEQPDAIRDYRQPVTPSGTRRDAYKAMQDKVNFNRFMDSISIQNTLPPAYEPQSNLHSEGGQMETIKLWEELSIPEKAAMMRVAVKNGITNLQDIKREYNEFAKGGPKKKSTSGWYQQHQNRWYNFLKSKGLNDTDSARLSGFFTAQDDLESAGGKSNAAREKNNFGGMQRGGKNIRYNTVEDYMQDKWKMMNSKFKSALGAKNIDEYATILGNPETAGKGYLYYVTDKVKYDTKSPQWKAAQKQHMQNYINGMRSRAGMGTVKFNNQPIASAKSSITPIVPINPSISQESLESPIPFTPFNPEAFFATPDTYQQPIIVEEPEAQEPVAISPYSPEEIERQKRMNRLSTFNRILSLTNPYPQEEDSFLSTIGLLTSNTFSKGGGIHIKPSHRGKLTELKKRTGKSEAELYKTGGPAVRKMITFARNARKWKHGLGGNLFDDGGSYSYTKPLDNVYVDSEGNLLDPEVPSARGTIQLPEIIATVRDPRKPVPTAFDKHEDLLRPMMDFVPGVGDALQVKDAITDAIKGDYLNAGLGAGLLLLPNAAEKSFKYLGKGIKRLRKTTSSKLDDIHHWTPEQWTAAQDAAIARGDMAEAQRLRDLHFQVSAPNTVASVNGQPLQLYHGTDATFNAFDISKYGNTDGGTFGRGLYTTPVKEYAELYGKNNMPLYMKLDNPRDYRNSSIGDLIAEKIAFGDDFATGIGIDGAIGRPSWKGFKGLEEYVSHNPKNIKSSLPITYDDNGVRIPLGLRDNFNINDIRYGLLPIGILRASGVTNTNE